MKQLLLILVLSIASVGITSTIQAAGIPPAVRVTADRSEIHAGESVTISISTDGIPLSTEVSSTGGTKQGYQITFDQPGMYVVTVTAFFSGVNGPVTASIVIIVQ